MKIETKRIFTGNAIIVAAIILFSIIGSSGHNGDLTAFIGLGFLFLAVLNIFVGVIFLLSGMNGRQNIKNYGAAMLAVAGISMLCSLTFCSMTFANL